MTNHAENKCDWLDDYLVGELPPVRTFEFKEHLDECMACRLEVDQWAAMSRMLKTATRELESPSATLPARIERERADRTQRNRRRAFRWRVAAVVGVCLLFATIFVAFERSTPRGEKTEDEVADRPWIEVITPSPLVELPDNVIGVPIDIGDRNVTVVWIYPTVQIETELK